MKRNIDEVLDAIAAAHAETRGRTLAQIDHAGDAKTAAARRLVAITLEDYAAELDAHPALSCWRHRKEMERALGGAPAVAEAFRAFSMARESEPQELRPEERALADAWLATAPRAHAAGIDGLGPAPTAWFDVRAVRAEPPKRVGLRSGPAQGDLF